MSEVIQVRVGEGFRELLGKVENPAALLGVAARVIDQENQFTVSHIQQTYLSFPKGGPSVANGLRVQTNRLRGSIRATKAVVGGGAVVSSIGSNVRYAAAHEFGTGPYTIKAKTSRGLRFRIGDKWITKQEVKHPGQKERAFVRTGIRDRLPEYGKSVGMAIVGFLGGKQ